MNSINLFLRGVNKYVIVISESLHIFRTYLLENENFAIIKKFSLQIE